MAAQNMVPSGSFGFLANAYQIDSNGSNGGAVLGVMNFDGAGNVTGTGTLKPRNTDPQKAQAIPTTFTGTYTSNPDGTGSVSLSFDLGFGATLAMVVTDGGRGIQLMQTNDPGGANITLRGSQQSVSGSLPLSFLFSGLAGNIPLTFSGATSVATTVYTSAYTTGTGMAQCPDGSTSTYSASVPVVTAAVTGGPGNVSGNFFAAVFVAACGTSDFETTSGLVTGSIGAGGATTLVLHATGFVISGTARAVQAGGSVNGSYGFQLNSSPFPAGTIGVMNFDGAGNVTLPFTAVGPGPGAAGMGTLTGTYSLNPDGTGTMGNFVNASGQSANATFSFVITDGGSQLLLLRTDGSTTSNVLSGTARLQ